MLGWQEKEDCSVVGLEYTLCCLHVGHEGEGRVKDGTRTCHLGKCLNVIQ